MIRHDEISHGQVAADTGPRWWPTLIICISAAFMISMDNTMLIVALPTMSRDFDVPIDTLEWVLAGYALTFATFLIIGGRLGDVFGHRRLLMTGLALFGIGSLIAALSQNVATLIIGEAVIEGIGAALMLPATLAILSGSFDGQRRAAAFATWGAATGIAVASGPVIGGVLSTYSSWRWGFGINVIITPFAMVAALMCIAPRLTPPRKVKIDAAGAALVSSGTFLLVFALSEGTRYGWWRPLADLSIGSHVLWSRGIGLSVTPLAIMLSVVLLVAFYRLERRKERAGHDPLFQFDHMRFRTFRWGLITGLILVMGQIAQQFTLAQFLQTSKHLSAAENGLWLLPFGISVFLGAQIAGRLLRRWDSIVVVRGSIVMAAAGTALILNATNFSITFWKLLPGLLCYGLGIGGVSGQLTAVAIAEVPKESSGVASGTQATSRQLGIALGVAIAAALLTTVTVNDATDEVERGGLPVGVTAEAVAGIRDLGATYEPPADFSPAEAATVTDALRDAVLDGSHVAITFALISIGVACLLSMLIPSAARARRMAIERHAGA